MHSLREVPWFIKIPGNGSLHLVEKRVQFHIAGRCVAAREMNVCFFCPQNTREKRGRGYVFFSVDPCHSSGV